MSLETLWMATLAVKAVAWLAFAAIVGYWMRGKVRR